MTIRDLIDELENLASDLGDDTEVRLAHQPSWPFEYSVETVTGLEAVTPDDIAAADADDEDAPGEVRDAVVYIGEGSQLGYLPGDASRALGWR